MNILNPNIVSGTTSAFQSLIGVSVIGGFLVLLVIAFHLTLAKRISPRWIYMIWFVIMLRFVFFAAPESPTSFLNLVRAKPAEPSRLVFRSTSGNPADSLVVTADSITPIPIEFSTTINEPSPSVHFDLWSIAFAVWALGVFFLLIRLAIGYWQIQRLVKSSTSASSDLDEQFDHLKKRMKTNSSASIRISTQLDSPGMVGIFHPVVLLPHWCVDELDREQLEMVFAHELTHIRRFDGLVQLLTHLIVVMHWFNPLSRVAAGFVESSRELACDRGVIEHLKTNLPYSHQSFERLERKYGQTILDIATRAGTENSAQSKQLCTAFIGGFIGSNKTLVKQRIAMLVDSNSKRRSGTVFAVACVLLLIAVGFTAAQTVQSPLQDVPTNPPLAPEYEKIRNSQTWTLKRQDSVPTPDASKAKTYKLNANGPLVMHPGDSKRLDFDYQVPELLVDNPLMIKATPLAPDEIMIYALTYGSTFVQVSNTEREIERVRIAVVPDVKDISAKVKTKFPNAPVGVIGTVDGFVDLHGHVTTKEVAQIGKFVAANCDLPVKNNLTDKQPVAIRIRCYEVSKTKLSQLGVDWSKAGKDIPKGTDTLKSIISIGKDPKALAKPTGFGLVDVKTFLPFIETLTKNDVAKLLTMPTMVTIDGRPAEFLSGGEVPIVTAIENGKKKVEFRSFGTKIHVTPHVHSKEHLTIEIRAEISELDADLGADGIPGFRVRRVNTGVRMEPGQTFAIIGDYRDDATSEESTEVLFLITPQLIEGTFPNSTSPIPGANSAKKQLPSEGKLSR